MPETKPWWASQTIISIVLTALSPVIYKVFKVTLGQDDVAFLAATTIAVVTGIVGIVGRLKAKKPIQGTVLAQTPTPEAGN